MSEVDDSARPCRNGRPGSFVATALILAAWGYADSPAMALPGDLEAITEAADINRDLLDIQAVVTVCTRCHVASQFLTTPRSYIRWEQVFARMSAYGATGSDDQLNRVIRYFDQNLTVINVNTSPVEELGPVLQISDAAADEIARLRSQSRFTTIADLKPVPGIDLKKLETMQTKGRLQF